MPNTQTTNQWSVNQTNGLPIVSTSSWFWFNGFDMCTSDFVITGTNIRDRDYNLNTSSNPYVDGWIVLSHLVNKKEIEFEFTMKADTKAELQTLIDTFKKATAVTEGELSFNFFWSTRVINCSITSDSYEQMPYGSNSQSWTISFRAVDPPRFHQKAPEARTYIGITTDLNGDITNDGSAKTFPIYYLIFGAVSGLDEINITLGGFITKINKTISTGDVLIVNWDITDPNGGNITVNGTEIDYSWPIDTQLVTGSNPFSITFNWTQTCNISILYTKYFE